VSLATPTGLVLARAVLEIQHWIALGRILVIIRRSVDETADGSIRRLGRKEYLA
jgi:hypothetical protein